MPRRDAIRRPRSGFARWTRRLLGMLATLAFLAVGVAIAAMIAPGGDEQVAAATASSKQHKASAGRPAGRDGLTDRQRAQRRRAVAELQRAGYVPVKLADYNPDHTLRVLIGKPAGATPKGLRAFFFVRDDYIGRDASAPALVLRPGLQLDRQITLVYTLYDPGDRECCPHGGDTRVHFRWTGARLKPQEPIPPAALRMPLAFAQ